MSAAKPAGEWLDALAERLPDVDRFLFEEERAVLAAWVRDIQTDARKARVARRERRE